VAAVETQALDRAGVWFAAPADLEMWLILGYVGVVLLGARLVEVVARLHFRRAQRLAEEGFEFDHRADQYRCPQGERLHLHRVDEANRLAIYRAAASSCRGCAKKALCTPHDEGRHIYRSLAAWAETDVGRFHQWVSLLMFAVAVALSVAGMLRWPDQPGSGFLAIAMVAGVGFLAWDLFDALRRRSEQGTTAPDG
jgi:hypothetical protein